MGSRLHDSYCEDLIEGKMPKKDIVSYLKNIDFEDLTDAEIIDKEKDFDFDERAIEKINVFWNPMGLIAIGKTSKTGTIFDLLEVYSNLRGEASVVSTNNGSDLTVLTQLASVMDSGCVDPELQAEQIKAVADPRFAPYIKAIIDQVNAINNQGPIR